ncbi:squalene/phytoene synthase family protein [Streptomyces parvulus]|uniref:squalene/phytoene synthase family protein n=1 Tax=Streptomyces parvulus TaxID=146923 RepID=UPI0033D046D2
MESPELRAAYEVCEAEARQFAVELWAAAETLPVETRPSLYAIASWSAYTDRIIDEGPYEGREERLAQWSADTLADLRAGHSSHPLRRALVDTVRRWGLDEALIEEHLDSARWTSRSLDPQLVVEVDVDVARDAAGRWRHPVRLHRTRPDLSTGSVPLFGK